MRYRPLGAHGQVVSAVSLVLEPEVERRSAGDWISLIYSALECGISGFEARGMDAALAEGLAQALEGVDRRIVFVGLRAGAEGEAASFADLGRQVKQALTSTRLGYLDALLLHPRAAQDTGLVRELSAFKSGAVVRAIGVAGDGEAVDEVVQGGGLDLLATGYSLLSGWSERRMIRDAVAADMAVLGYDAFPRHQLEPLMRKRPKDRSNPLAGVGGYRFLDETRDWTAEELCLAYALTEPSLATVLVRPESVDHLERLAAVADRDLPAGVSAQIEMARFSALGEDDARRSA